MISWTVIARKEALEIIRSPKFAWTFGVCALLLVLAFYVGGRDFLLEQVRWEAARSENLRQMEGEVDWLEIAPTLSLPPQPISGLVGGVAHDIGRHATIEGRGPIRPWGSRYGADPVFAIFRFLDLEFVFRIVLSLFAMLFAFDAVCGEKERGTLRLCLSFGVTRSTFLCGKVLGTLGALLLPLLIPVGLGCLLWIGLGIPMELADWLRVGLLVATGFLYVSTFLILAIWISSLTSRSSHAFLLLLSTWVVLVLIIPPAAVVLSARQVPVLSRDEIQRESSRLRSQLWQEDHEAMRSEMSAAMSGAGSDLSIEQRMELLTQQIEDRSNARDQKLKDLERSLDEKRRSEQALQQAVAFGLARVSPAAALNLASQQIAGNSASLERHFRQELEDYQAQFGRFQEAKSGGRRSGGPRVRIQLGEEAEVEPEPIDVSELPEFSYRRPSLASGVQSALPGLALLAVMDILLFAAAFMSFLRYDPR